MKGYELRVSSVVSKIMSSSRPSNTGLPLNKSTLSLVETAQGPKLSTRVYFRTRAPSELTASTFAEAKKGFRLFIVGSSPELGAWEPAKGLEIFSQQDLFPVYLSEGPAMIGSGDANLFRVLISRKSVLKGKKLYQYDAW